MASRVAVHSAGRGGARRPESADLWSGSTHTPSGGWGVARSHARASYGDLGAAIEASGSAPAQHPDVPPGGPYPMATVRQVVVRITPSITPTPAVTN